MSRSTTRLQRSPSQREPDHGEGEERAVQTEERLVEVPEKICPRVLSGTRHRQSKTDHDGERDVLRQNSAKSHEPQSWLAPPPTRYSTPAANSVERTHARGMNDPAHSISEEPS